LLELAELQQQRAQIQVDQYEEWLDAGRSIWENLTLAFLQASAMLQMAAGPQP
jgi:hypothetical protein